MTVGAVVEKVASFNANHVVITGGEPMIAAGIKTLTAEVRAIGKHITIETAGTVDEQVDCDLISISPKLSNSTPAADRAGEWRQRHENRRLNVEAVRGLISRHEYQLKFVVCQPEDLTEIQEYCAQLGSIETSRVLLMPEGTELSVLEQRNGWVRDSCEEFGFTFCPRMHIVWFGNRRGT